jgi:hypothetical protein
LPATAGSAADSIKLTKRLRRILAKVDQTQGWFKERSFLMKLFRRFIERLPRKRKPASIKPKTKYKHVKQKPFCCVPTCIQMILHRNGFKGFTQLQIAEHLNFKVPPKYAKVFGERFVSIKEPSRGYGAQQTPENINAFFKKFGIPLRTERHPISLVKNPAEFLLEQLRQGRDVMVLFSVKAFDPKASGGHAVLVSEINQAKKAVRVVDPESRIKSYWLPLQKLIEAMSSKWDGNEREFYVFFSQ